MSEAPADICDVDALLDEVAALDMALLRHVNAVALATTEPEVLNGLVRSQQRLARSVRTTLTTKARLADKRAAKDRPAAHDRPLTAYPWDEPAADEEGDDDDDDRHDAPSPKNQLQHAAQARIRLEYDPVEADEIEDRLPTMIYRAWDDGYDRLSPDDRLDRFMALVRRTFGPPRTARPQPPSTVEPRQAPAWRRPPPAVPDPGGGSAW